MEDYRSALIRHLVRYAAKELKTTAQGTYRGKRHDHILPIAQRELNLLAGCRDEIARYIADNALKIHRNFHHLNSSQAFALNLFYPYLANATTAQPFFEAMGTPSCAEARWSFESVPYPEEGTNVDVSWEDSFGSRVFCEVKLSEDGFGAAAHDERHRAKLATIYRPRLSGMVPDSFLREEFFFRNYQVLRNLQLLHSGSRDIVVFLFPRRNRPVDEQLSAVLQDLPAPTLARVRVVYAEDLTTKLATDSKLSPDLRRHAQSVAEKYFPLPVT